MTASTIPVQQLTAALADGVRVLGDLAADAHAEPCVRTLDAVLSQARGITLIALRAHRQIDGDRAARDPIAPIGKTTPR